MKKISFITLFAAVIGMTIMSSCKKDTTYANPTVSFQGGNTSMVYPTDTAIDVNVTFAADGKIESVTLLGPSLTGAGTTTTTITDKMGTSGSDNAKGTTSATYLFKVSSVDLAAAFVNHTTLTYTFTVTDQQSSSTTGTYTVTMTPINTYTGISLTSAYSDPTANEYYDATTGTAYNHADGNAANSTFGFVSGGGHGAIIFGSDFSLTLSSQPASWATGARFATTTLSATEFDAITDETALLAAMPATIDQTEIFGLEDGGNQYADNSSVTVIAFQVGTKKGFIKLPTSLNNNTDQTISIDVKVQQ